MPHAFADRFFLQTLGCKVNQYECRALTEAWLRAGLCPADGPDRAGLVVLCTCAVTARAEAESRRLARGLVREAAPGARVVVTGCAAAVAPRVFSDLGALAAPDKAALARNPCLAAPGPVPDAYPALAVSGHDRARALLKIQDGCSHGCSYCIVPLARGASRSRPLADILAEADRLVAAGHGELGLTGINLGHFGRDLCPALDLWDLVAILDRHLADRHGGAARLRLGSLDPSILDAKGLAVLAASRAVCPHLHVSLQSAAPDVLAAMGRRPDDARTVSSFVDGLGGIWPSLGLGCDIMAGFPGETAADHQRTLAFLAGLPLTYAHVFPYSRRPGTRAAARTGQLPREVKSARAAALRALARDKTEVFLDALARARGPVTVALERTAPAAGTTEYYSDCRLEGDPGRGTGALVRARLTGRDGEVLLGRVEPREAPA